MAREIHKVKVNGEEVNLVRGSFNKGWRIVYPPRKPNGNINWFPSWDSFLSIMAWSLLIAFIFLLWNLQNQEFIAEIENMKDKIAEHCPTAFRDVSLNDPGRLRLSSQANLSEEFFKTYG